MATKGKMVKGTSGKDVLKGGAGNDTLYGYAGNDNLQGGAGNDNLRGGAGNDTLTGGVGKDTFAYANGEGKDIINDYKAGQDTLYISSGAISKTSLSGKNIIFTVGKGSVTLKNAATQTISLRDSRGSYTMSKTALALTSNFGGTMDAAKYLATVKTLDGSKTTKAVNLYGNAAANTIKGGSGKNTLLGYAGNDYLYGYAGNDVLNGGVGNDYLDGGKGGDTLTGGAGNDVFVYRDGDGADTINDYEQGKDTFYLAKGAFKSTAISGKNLVFNVGSGKVTMKNAAAKTITLKNADGGIYTMTKTALTAKSGFGGTMSAAAHLSTITNVNAAAATKASVLYGNSQANTITGGSANDKLYGNAGNDKLNGGKGNDYLDGGIGNDTLTGGAGNDTFFFGANAGTDIITDYAEGELLHINSGTISKATLSNNNKDMSFTVGSGTVTLTNAGEKTISLKDSHGSYTLTKTGLTLGADFSGTLDATKYLSTITTIDGHNTTKAADLYGNSKANVLRAGKAGGTLRGYAGDDTLYGGMGKDVFYYDSGEDTIYDYEEGKDIIHLGAITVSSVEIDGNDGVLKLSSGGTITIKEATGTTIDYLDSNGGIKTIKIQDTTQSTNGNDNLNGSAGNDVLNGGEGDDTLTGGIGKDTFAYSQNEGNDVIADYTEGEDVLHITNGTITGTSLINNNKDMVFTVGSGTVTLQNAGEKAISLKDNRGSYTMTKTRLTLDADFTGTMDATTYLSTITTIDGTVAKQSIEVVGNNLANTIKGGNGNNRLSGEAGNDIICGNSGNDTLEGGNGNDILYGGNGNDLMNGGAGRDTFVYEGGNDLINDYEVGKDTIWFKSTMLQVNKSVGNDILLTLRSGGTILVKDSWGKEISYKDQSGEEKKIVVGLTQYGTDGDDSLIAAGDQDDEHRIYGLDGNDSLTGGDSNDLLDGGAGNDSVEANLGDDTLYGGLGYDVLRGNGGNDMLYGGDGKDNLNGGRGRDYLYGEGDDDHLDGEDGNDYLNGGDGNDYLNGGSGNDYLDGGDGDDSLLSGDGNDTLYGGVGNDTFSTLDGRSNVLIIMEYEEGKDTIFGSGTTLRTSEAVGNDVLLTLARGATITVKDAKWKEISFVNGDGEEQKITVGISKYGTDSDDNLFASNDDGERICGLAGNDTLTGGSGNERLEGGEGDDILYAGGGNNTILGGYGNDIFVYGGGNDTISDYTVSEDTICLNGVEIAFCGIVGDNDRDVQLTMADGGTITLTNGARKTISYTTEEGGAIRILTVDSDGNITCGSASLMMASSTSPLMIPDSASIVGTVAAQLSSLVSMAQTGSFGALPGTSTGLVSDSVADGSLVVANGTATANPLTNQQTA